MNQNITALKSKQSQVMTTEQFEEIIDAILSGKYSWACVLILRFANYNPLHYIPYRTYKRLLKDHQTKGSFPPLSVSYDPNRRELSTVKYP
jgi:hypothetical protein